MHFWLKLKHVGLCHDQCMAIWRSDRHIRNLNVELFSKTPVPSLIKLDIICTCITITLELYASMPLLWPLTFIQVTWSTFIQNKQFKYLKNRLCYQDEAVDIKYIKCVSHKPVLLGYFHSNVDNGHTQKFAWNRNIWYFSKTMVLRFFKLCMPRISMNVVRVRHFGDL